ncbi:MAG: metal-dependent hydrolase [Planctomycetota bacterium]|nr:metal-dependent hydrolase [Planctomycetota bacterium]
MDTVTQGLLGAVTAQLGFRERIGRDASWVAAATAVVPDLDIFVKPLLQFMGVNVNGLNMMHIHRGLSHSLLMTPVIAAAAAGLWWLARRRALRNANASGRSDAETHSQPSGARRRPTFGLLYACCFVAALSHPILDWCTSYGTQILSPITKTRYAIDAIPIVDIFYTPALILTLLACRLVRWFKGGSCRAAIIVGIAGFTLSCGYIAAGLTIGLRLRAATEKTLNLNHTRAYPMLGTIFLWRITAVDDDAWYVARHNVLFSSPLDKDRFVRIDKVDNEWVRRAARLEEVKTFKWFAMGQVRAAYRRRDGLHFIEFHDMRYGSTPGGGDSMWPMLVTFDETGQVLNISHRSSHRRADRGELIRRIWRDTWNP